MKTVRNREIRNRENQFNKLKDNQDPQVFICDDCNEHFTNGAALYKHISSEHWGEDINSVIMDNGEEAAPEFPPVFND